MARATLAAIAARAVPKGDPLEVARVAAIQAVKNTASIIPYCHPIPVEFAGVGYRTEEDGIVVEVTVRAVARTGVEMEALTGASVAALTLYDMLKMLDETMAIGEVRLLEKRGGKSDAYGAAPPGLRAAVVVLSDSVAAGRADDTAGRLITERLRALGIEAPEPVVLPDDRQAIADRFRRLADGGGVDLVVSTGGTGLGPRDVTPEALLEVLERRVPGVEEAVRSYGQQRTPLAMLSRSVAGTRGRTLFVALPGSEAAARDGMDALFPAVLHALAAMRGTRHDGRGS